MSDQTSNVTDEHWDRFKQGTRHIPFLPTDLTDLACAIWPIRENYGLLRGRLRELHASAHWDLFPTEDASIEWPAIRAAIEASISTSVRLISY